MGQAVPWANDPAFATTPAKAQPVSKPVAKAVPWANDPAFRTSASAPAEKYSPVSNSNTENFLAGMGKAFVDTYHGAKQLGAEGLNAISPSLVSNKTVQQLRQEADETRLRDAPLMNTKAGMGGNVAGSIATVAPAAFIPGANTYAAAGLIGGLSGATQPVGVNDSRLLNAGAGAAFGVGGQAIGRAVVGAGRVAKAAVQPFTNSGQNQIVAKVLRNFVADPQAAAAKAATAPNIPGYAPTLAEATQDPGIAQLQRALSSANPHIGNSLTMRDVQNLQAFKNGISSIAGDDASRAAAVTARSQAAAPLYAQADAAQVPGNAELAELLKRPSVQAAFGRAQRLAADKGEALQLQAASPASEVSSGILDASGSPITATQPAQDALYSGRGLHYLKMGMDDMLDNPGTSGIGKNEQGAIRGNLDALTGWMDQNVPGYGAARQAFATGSEPINKMDVAKALYQKLTPALDDFSAQPSVRASRYAEALRNGDSLAQNVTGLNNATLEGTLGADFGTVNDIADALARRGGAQTIGKAVGSNTAQNLASQNLIGELTDTLPIPNWMKGARIGDTLTRPFTWALHGQDPSIQQKLADALMGGYSPDLFAAPAQSQALANALRGFTTISGYLLPKLNGLFPVDPNADFLANPSEYKLLHPSLW